MRSLWIVLAALGWVVGYGQSAPKDAVVRLEFHQQVNGRTSVQQGTGNVIATSEQGSWILTNAHVIPRGGGSGSVVVDCPHYAKGDKAIQARVVSVDHHNVQAGTGRDLGLIWVNVKLPYSVPVAPLGYQIQGGVYSVGYDGDYQNRGPQRMKYVGSVTRVPWQQSSNWTYTTFRTSPGHSGGALISGEYLVGTNFGVMDRYGRYTSLSSIHAFLADAGFKSQRSVVQQPRVIQRNPPRVIGGYSPPGRVICFPGGT